MSKKLLVSDLSLEYKGKKEPFTSEGNGPISAFVNGIRENYNLEFKKEFGN